MADAGKIMIMPKGAYDASASYEVLDLVTHMGNVWVAKRNVTGVEPSEANSADWFLMADLANYLPLSGGTVKDGSRTPLRVSNSVASKVAIAYFNNDTLLAEIGVNVNKPFFRKDGVETDILHTGNKPSGSYTGNGSATSRTIATGGIGNCCLVYRIDGAVMAIVSPNGATTTITLDGYTGSSHSFISNSKMAFSNGVLTIATDNANVNMSGAIFYYQVL